MSIEHIATAKWLYATLSGDATLASLVGTRIYDTIAPQSATYPLVVFQYQGGSDLTGVTEGTRVLVNGLYVVKAIATGTFTGTLQNIAARIDVLLQRTRGTSTEGTIISSARVQPFVLTTAEDNTIYRHLGGIYRIRTQKA